MKKKPIPVFFKIFIIVVILLVVGSVGSGWWTTWRAEVAAEEAAQAERDAKLTVQVTDAQAAVKQLANKYCVEEYKSVEVQLKPDPWDNAYYIEYHMTGRLWYKKYYMTVRSYGPDGKRNTADDVTDERLLE